jgi:hypothetical protein
MKFNLGSLHDLKAVGGSMSRAVDKRLIEVQDRVRDHFGWAYSDDLQSARALMEACEAHPRALELGWDTQGREAMLGGVARTPAQCSSCGSDWCSRSAERS